MATTDKPSRGPITQGLVRARPPRNLSQAHPGVNPLPELTYATQRFQPLPVPVGAPPYRYDLAEVLPDVAQTASRSGKLAFHAVGDTGGIKDATFQNDVAAAMAAELGSAASPLFFYHLGDVVYFNGEVNDYYSQFYEPYEHYSAPILSIPGNHDGDPVDAGQVSLDGWVRYFMTRAPAVDPISRDAPRVTLSLPNVYWTLAAPFVTIVGMYTNVPEGGSIDSIQQQWLTNELADAPDDRALIIALHHPIYSFDDHHSGSSRMADAVQHAINDTKRIPNLVLTGHVHNYQRVEKKIDGGLPTPFIVVGGGGYHNLHHFNTNVHPKDGPTTDPNTGATLVAGVDHEWSFLTLSVTKKEISGVVTSVARDGAVTRKVDSFSYSAAAARLSRGSSAEL